MRRALLTRVSKPNPLAGVNIGDAFMGGYYAGTMDTTKGNIIAADASQIGKRYALIVAPKSLENASLAWKNAATDGPTGVQTRWDGLGSTNAMVAGGSSSVYPAAWYCAGLTHPSDTASAWYLPAMDELEVLYRNLKCSTESNYTTSSSWTFPPTAQTPGVNPSSDPTGVAYTSSVPGQTSVTAFQTGQAQALGVSGTQNIYYSSTEAASGSAWFQSFSGPNPGWVNAEAKTNTSYVRPVRRLILT